MALSATMGGQHYAGSSSLDEKEAVSGFEFTRRKRWPGLLLQELVGSALFCLKPLPSVTGGSSHSPSGGLGWKMVYVSPAVGDMLGQKASDLEGKEFFDLVFAPDQPQLQTLFTSLVSPAPPLPHSSSSETETSSSMTITPPNPQNTPIPKSGKSHTIYARMLAEQPVVWELRAHATGLEALTDAIGAGLSTGTAGFGYGGAGTMVPTTAPNPPAYPDDMKGKAVWVMGRRAREPAGENDGNSQSLDSFLELKLENERLREELRDLQSELDDEDLIPHRPLHTEPVYHLSSPSSSSPSSSSSASPSNSPKPKIRREKKKTKKDGLPLGSNAAAMIMSAGRGGPGGGGEGEGMHVCVTCGRTDSPEWRKGPLGPKTLCNACGLRWAKRNSTAPSRKDKKAAAERKP